MLSTGPHHIVVVFEHISVSHPVVHGQIVTHLRLIGTSFYWTLERSNLEYNFVSVLMKVFLVNIT